MSSYAIIKVGGKQYRVGLGERLLVDRLKTEPGKTFSADVLLAEGDLDSKAAVTVRVVDHVKGPKIRIGKYKPKSGYKKHTGFRASLTQIEIESIGSAKAKAKASPAAEKAAPAIARTKLPVCWKRLHAMYEASRYNAPWAMLTILITPSANENPLATTNSKPPKVSPSRMRNAQSCIQAPNLVGWRYRSA